MTTVTIDLSEQQAALLAAKASAQGLTLAAWLVQIAEQHAPSSSVAHLQQTNPAEWARHFHVWAENHDRTKPPLSDEAVGRESIYPDRI